MSTTFDPIELKILWNRLIAIVDEASATLVRTSFSTVVRESNDYACVLLDRDGRLLAQNSASIPSFIGCLPVTVRHFLRRFPPSELHPGDVLITNDPWLATGHLPDITVAMPVFRNDDLVGFAASVAHSPDIGGRLRGPDSRQVFEEGLQIPVVKLYDGGRLNELLIEILRKNVRVPDQVIGDLMAQVVANEMTGRRLNELLDEYRLDDLRALASQINDQSEAAMRSAIARIPNGEYYGEEHPDGDEEPLLITARITVHDNEIEVDYTGTSRQVDNALNTVLNYTFAYTAYPLKCLTTPAIPNNDGAFRPIRVTAPEGSLLNPRYPAAVGGRALIGHFLSAVVFKALADVIPEDVQAPGGAPLWCLTLTGEQNFESYAGVYFLNGGQGASARQNGVACLSFPSNVSNTPVELMEQGTPIRIERKELREGSGGSGMRHGGNGQFLDVRLIADTPATASFLADRLRHPAQGILGGAAGHAGEVTLNGTSINPKRQIRVQPGDLIRLATPGGGGYGMPSR